MKVDINLHQHSSEFYKPYYFTTVYLNGFVVLSMFIRGENEMFELKKNTLCHLV